MAWKQIKTTQKESFPTNWNFHRRFVRFRARDDLFWCFQCCFAFDVFLFNHFFLTTLPGQKTPKKHIELFFHPNESWGLKTGGLQIPQKKTQQKTRVIHPLPFWKIQSLILRVACFKRPVVLWLEIQDYDGGDFQFEVLGNVGEPQNLGRWFSWIPIVVRWRCWWTIRNQCKWWGTFDLDVAETQLNLRNVR